MLFTWPLLAKFFPCSWLQETVWNNRTMCKPGHLDISPATSVSHAFNSTTHSQQLKDSVATVVSVNVTGSVIVVLLLILSFCLSYGLYKLMKLHYTVHHQRYLNIARHVNYPTGGAEVPVIGSSMTLSGLRNDDISRSEQ